MPCWNEYFKGSHDAPEYFQLYLNIDPIVYTWDDFKQIPECNYTKNYILTMFEMDINAEHIKIPEFSTLVEGSVEVPAIVEFDSEARTVTFQASNMAY